MAGLSISPVTVDLTTFLAIKNRHWLSFFLRDKMDWRITNFKKFWLVHLILKTKRSSASVRREFARRWPNLFASLPACVIRNISTAGTGPIPSQKAASSIFITFLSMREYVQESAINLIGNTRHISLFSFSFFFNSLKTPLLCENRPPKSPSSLRVRWPILLCCRTQMCNKEDLRLQQLTQTDRTGQSGQSNRIYRFLFSLSLTLTRSYTTRVNNNNTVLKKEKFLEFSRRSWRAGDGR